jgi:hypothetical protein
VVGRVYYLLLGYQSAHARLMSARTPHNLFLHSVTIRGLKKCNVVYLEHVSWVCGMCIGCVCHRCVYWMRLGCVYLGVCVLSVSIGYV